MKNLQEEIDAWSAAAIVLATVVGFVLVLCVILMLIGARLTMQSADSIQRFDPQPARTGFNQK